MTHTPGPVTVSAGDEGGVLSDGATVIGEISAGDLDVWTFSANAGDRIAAHVGEFVDNSGFYPWGRVWAPNGDSLGSDWDSGGGNVSTVAPATGTYLVLVASADSSGSGGGEYELTMTLTP